MDNNEQRLCARCGLPLGEELSAFGSQHSFAKTCARLLKEALRVSEAQRGALDDMLRIMEERNDEVEAELKECQESAVGTR